MVGLAGNSRAVSALPGAQQLIQAMKVETLAAADVFKHLPYERQSELVKGSGLMSVEDSLLALQVSALLVRHPYCAVLGAEMLRALVEDLLVHHNTHHANEEQVLSSSMRLAARDANDARQVILQDRNQLSFKLNACMRELQTALERLTDAETEASTLRNSLAEERANSSLEVVRFLKDENERLVESNKKYLETIVTLQGEMSRIRTAAATVRNEALPPDMIDRLISSYSDLDRLVSLIAKRADAVSDSGDNPMLYIANLHAKLLESKLQKEEAKLKRANKRLSAFETRAVEMRMIVKNLLTHIETLEADKRPNRYSVANRIVAKFNGLSHRVVCAIRSFKNPDSR